MIKRLAGCIRQYKRDTVLTPLFMLGEVAEIASSFGHCEQG